jgi:hypothetical protein
MSGKGMKIMTTKKHFKKKTCTIRKKTAPTVHSDSAPSAKPYKPTHTPPTAQTLLGLLAIGGGMGAGIRRYPFFSPPELSGFSKNRFSAHRNLASAKAGDLTVPD